MRRLGSFGDMVVRGIRLDSTTMVVVLPAVRWGLSLAVDYVKGTLPHLNVLSLKVVEQYSVMLSFPYFWF